MGLTLSFLFCIIYVLFMKAEAVQVKPSPLSTGLSAELYDIHSRYYTVYFCVFLNLYLLTQSFAHPHRISVPYFVRRTCVGRNIVLRPFFP